MAALFDGEEGRPYSASEALKCSPPFRLHMDYTEFLQKYMCCFGEKAHNRRCCTHDVGPYCTARLGPPPPTVVFYSSASNKPADKSPSSARLSLLFSINVRTRLQKNCLPFIGGWRDIMGGRCGISVTQQEIVFELYSKHMSLILLTPSSLSSILAHFLQCFISFRSFMKFFRSLRLFHIRRTLMLVRVPPKRCLSIRLSNFSLPSMNGQSLTCYPHT